MHPLKKCSTCGKLSDLTTTCSYLEGTEIELCPTCLEKDGSFCVSCGQFCAGLQGFEFIHPGYCDNCWDEIESDCGDWEDEEEPEQHNP